MDLRYDGFSQGAGLYACQLGHPPYRSGFCLWVRAQRSWQRNRIEVEWIVRPPAIGAGVFAEEHRLLIYLPCFPCTGAIGEIDEEVLMPGLAESAAEGQRADTLDVVQPFTEPLIERQRFDPDL